MKRIADTDGIELELTADAESYIGKTFVLRFSYDQGQEMEIELDGVEVGDIITDARNAGVPVEWKPLERKEEAGPKPEGLSSN